MILIRNHCMFCGIILVETPSTRPTYLSGDARTAWRAAGCARFRSRDTCTSRSRSTGHRPRSGCLGRWSWSDRRWPDGCPRRGATGSAGRWSASRRPTPGSRSDPWRYTGSRPGSLPARTRRLRYTPATARPMRQRTVQSSVKYYNW